MPTRLSLLTVFTMAALIAVGTTYAQSPKQEPSKAAPKEKAPTTLENLNAAFNGESNANARYLAFAKKADEEGFAGAASLFRAAARAEEVHANSHAAVIKTLGGQPKADIKPPQVKSTKDNVQAALEGETYERDTMYPEFITLAKKENNKDALRTFNFAITAEIEHAKLYGEALKGLESWKAAKTFYVCSVCGYTTTKIDFEKCASCFSPKEKYETIK